MKIDGSKVASLLLINETLDAATPFAGSLEVRKRFPKARLIEERGGTTTPARCSATPASTTASRTTWPPGSCPKRKSGDAPT